MEFASIGVSFDVQQIAALLDKKDLLCVTDGVGVRGNTNAPAGSALMQSAIESSIQLLSLPSPAVAEDAATRFVESCDSLPAELAIVSMNLDVDVQAAPRVSRVADGVTVTRVMRGRKPLWHNFRLKVGMPKVGKAHRVGSRQHMRDAHNEDGAFDDDDGDGDEEEEDEDDDDDDGLEGEDDDEYEEVDSSLLDFIDVIEDSGASMKGDLIKEADGDTGARRKWWNTRVALDERLSSVLSTIQKKWLGPLRVLLMPPAHDEFLREHWWTRAQDIASNMPGTMCKIFGTSTTEDEGTIATWIDVLVNGASELKVQEMRDAICTIVHVGHEQVESSSAATGFVDELCDMIFAAHEAGLVALATKSAGERPAQISEMQGEDDSFGSGKRASSASEKGSRRSARRSKSAVSSRKGSQKSSGGTASASRPSAPIRRGALMLIPGELGRLYNVPFESLPILRSQHVCRMPSMCSALSLLSLRRCFSGLGKPTTKMQHQRTALKSSPLTDAVTVNGNLAYYLLNPSSDLKHTQSVFEPIFTSDPLNWLGDAGKAPDSKDILRKLVGKELFVYMGHGAAEMYLSPRALAMMMKSLAANVPRHGRNSDRRLDDENEETFNDENDDGKSACVDDPRQRMCVLANLLMGCSSGALTCTGDHFSDCPSGTVLAYIMSGSSMTCANLWDVTDKDIDRFSESLLAQWFRREPIEQIRPSSSTSSSKMKCAASRSDDTAPVSMGGAIASSRRACRLPYLNGAAPVYYGVPTFISL